MQADSISRRGYRNDDVIMGKDRAETFAFIVQSRARCRSALEPRLLCRNTLHSRPRLRMRARKLGGNVVQKERRLHVASSGHIPMLV